MRDADRPMIRMAAGDLLHLTGGARRVLTDPEALATILEGWDDARPAVLRLARGEAPSLLDGRHRLTHLATYGAADMPVPVRLVIGED